MRHLFLGLAIVSAAFGVQSQPAAARAPRLISEPAMRPLVFEPNQGQTDPSVRFIARGSNFTFFLTQTEIVLSAADTLRMTLSRANGRPTITGLEPLPGRVNYYLGNDPSKWRSGIPVFGRVRYENVYAGIDVEYYGREGALEYDLVIYPGADPSVIEFQFAGADDLTLDDQGNLVFRTANGSFVQHAPVAYQEASGTRSSVTAKYILRGGFGAAGPGSVGLALGPYNPAYELIIDPVLAYSTYLGGSLDDHGMAIDVDNTGSIYVTGWTSSLDFPTTRQTAQTLPPQPLLDTNRVDGFVTKLDPRQTGPLQLVYSTYLGSPAWDIPSALAVAADGSAYVTGITRSLFNFPTSPQAYRHGTDRDFSSFVTKLTPLGRFSYSTYFQDNSYPQSIALDAAGQAYVSGLANLGFGVTENAFQSELRGIDDGFVAALDPEGSQLIYATFLGGDGGDSSNAIALDSDGNIYVSGATTSMNFPVTSDALQTTNHGGITDAFVTRLDPRGAGAASLLYSTYLGGTDIDQACGLGIDSLGAVYVSGSTWSQDFPVTPAAAQPVFGGGADAFAFKLDLSLPLAQRLVYSTYYGGSEGEDCASLDVDGTGRAVFTGVTGGGLPTVRPVQPQHGGSNDLYIAMLDPTGSRFSYATYLGGERLDNPSAIAVDGAGNAYVTGVSASLAFPTTLGAYQPVKRPLFDAFVSVIGIDNTAALFGGRLEAIGQESSTTIVFPQASSTGGKATLSGEIPLISGAAGIFGSMRYVDHVLGFDLTATTIDAAVVDSAGTTCAATANGRHVRVVGRATVRGVPGQSFRIDADDCGEPGATRDYFAIAVSGPSIFYSNEGRLVSGNIEVP